MLLSLRLINLLFFSLCLCLDTLSQERIAVYPDTIGQRVRCEMMIEMPKAYVSGMLIMHKPSEGVVNASMVNEFGISLMDFCYEEKKEKIKFYSLTDKLNKWYIRKTLAKDLKQVLRAMQDGAHEYINSKRKIKYSFQPANETE